MSNVGRIFLEGGTPYDHSGSRVNLGLSFTSEKDLDEKLWLDPEAAPKDLEFLLKVHRNETTPALSRLALKAITFPLFVREFYGTDTPPEITEAIRGIPKRNSRLLDAYLDRVNDDSIDQAVLKQAIDDATVLQLVTRSLATESPEDTVLLPLGPEEDYLSAPTTFTVLRRQNLGRALLFVSNVRPNAHKQTPQAKPHRIQIRPADLLIDDATRFDLAETLIAEQGTDDLSIEEQEFVEYAAAQVNSAIAAHFEHIPTIV